MGRYERPADLETAIGLRASGSWTVLAGGTDHYPARVGDREDEDVLDLTGIASLRGISAIEAGGWRIGATATWTDIVGASLPPVFDSLKAAAREVGGIQIQNRGTIGGNLCNASPAADGVPPLLSLDAAVELTGPNGPRTLPLSEFILGNRHTALGGSELVTAIVIPAHGGSTRSAFLKLGARKYLVISIAMVAAVISTDEAGRIDHARIAVGACSTAACRLPVVEASLIGAHPAKAAARLYALFARSGETGLEALSPIDDVRATAAYRRDSAATLIGRAVAEALDLPREAA